MIHQYKLGGLPIVLDTCSGSVHIVDEIAYDMIALYEEKSREEIMDAMQAKKPPATTPICRTTIWTSRWTYFPTCT